MMLYDFSLLAEAKQVDLLYKEGIYIGKRKLGSITAVLYQLDSFYVEVFYHHYRVSIHNLRCFKTTDGLDPYLNQINVEHLIHL